MIPLWLRLLAAVVAATAVLAIVLLVRSAWSQAVDVPGVIGLVAQAVLFVCFAALCGYVAVTGLPPAHLWPGSGLPWWPARPAPLITPELHRFLALLRQRHPGLRECWLLDTVAGDQWWLLAMADGPVLEAVRGDWDIRRQHGRLYLLDERSGTVTAAWGRSTPDVFSAWDWEPQAESRAEYRCPVAGEIRLAQRIWN